MGEAFRVFWVLLVDEYKNLLQETRWAGTPLDHAETPHGERPTKAKRTHQQKNALIP